MTQRRQTEEERGPATLEVDCRGQTPEEGWWILTSRSSRSPQSWKRQCVRSVLTPGGGEWPRGHFWFCASHTQSCQRTDFWCFQGIQFVVICHGSKQKTNTLSFYHHHFLMFQQRTFYCSKNKWPEIGWKRGKQGLRGRNWRKNLKTGQNQKSNVETFTININSSQVNSF